MKNPVARRKGATKPRDTRPKRHYTVVYQPVLPEEGSGFYAHVPALGITTEGESLNGAKAMAQDAIEGFIEAAKEIGRALPHRPRSLS